MICSHDLLLLGLEAVEQDIMDASKHHVITVVIARPSPAYLRYMYLTLGRRRVRTTGR